MKFIAIILLSIIQYACADDVSEAIKSNNLEVGKLSNEYVNVTSVLKYFPKILKFMADVEKNHKWKPPLQKGEIFVQLKFGQTMRQVWQNLTKVQEEYLKVLIYPTLTNEKFEAIKNQKAKCDKSENYQKNAVKAVEDITKCVKNSIKNLPNLWEITESKIDFERRLDVYTKLLQRCLENKDEKCLLDEIPALHLLLQTFSKYLLKLQKNVPSDRFLQEENKFLVCSHKLVRPFYINHCG